MYKKKVTNTSHESVHGARAIFLTEAGKLLKPGESCVLNRLNSGTERLVTSKLLTVEDGAFEKAPLFPKEEKPPKKAPIQKITEVAAAPPKVEVASPEKTAEEETPVVSSSEGSESSPEEADTADDSEPTRRGGRRRRS